jgi:hypothetical protein
VFPLNLDGVQSRHLRSYKSGFFAGVKQCNPEVKRCETGRIIRRFVVPIKFKRTQRAVRGARMLCLRTQARLRALMAPAISCLPRDNFMTGMIGTPSRSPRGIFSIALGFRTHGNGTTRPSRCPQGILSIAVGSEPTEMQRRPIPIPAGDLVNSRGFRTHGNGTKRPIPIPAGDLVNSRGFRTHGNATAPHPDRRRGSCQSPWVPNPRNYTTPHPDPCRGSCQ